MRAASTPLPLDLMPLTPLAACALVRRADGKILGVSRRNDPSDFGLPGGKVEPKEMAIETAVRELKEETGLTAINPQLVFYSPNGPYVTLTFACDVEGDISTAEEGVVEWVSPHVLVQGSFGDYNTRLFRHLGIDLL